MYIQCINYNFSIAIGPHVCGSWNNTKKNKIEKIMQCPSIKSLLFWYGSVFVPKKKILLCIYYSKMQKLHIF
jgi:hypothetical protein